MPNIYTGGTRATGAPPHSHDRSGEEASSSRRPAVPPLVQRYVNLFEGHKVDDMRDRYVRYVGKDSEYLGAQHRLADTLDDIRDDLGRNGNSLGAIEREEARLLDIRNSISDDLQATRREVRAAGHHQQAAVEDLHDLQQKQDQARKTLKHYQAAAASHADSAWHATASIGTLANSIVRNDAEIAAMQRSLAEVRYFRAQPLPPHQAAASWSHMTELEATLRQFRAHGQILARSYNAACRKKDASDGVASQMRHEAKLFKADGRAIKADIEEIARDADALAREHKDLKRAVVAKKSKLNGLDDKLDDIGLDKLDLTAEAQSLNKKLDATSHRYHEVSRLLKHARAELDRMEDTMQREIRAVIDQRKASAGRAEAPEHAQAAPESGTPRRSRTQPAPHPQGRPEARFAARSGTTTTAARTVPARSAGPTTALPAAPPLPLTYSGQPVPMDRPFGNISKPQAMSADEVAAIIEDLGYGGLKQEQLRSAMQPYAEHKDLGWQTFVRHYPAIFQSGTGQKQFLANMLKLYQALPPAEDSGGQAAGAGAAI